MKTKNILLSFLSLAVVSGAGLVIANSAFAYQGDPSVKGPNYAEERHAAMEVAFDNNDYAAWLKLMTGKGRVTQVINKDNFKQFSDAHKLAEEGKIAEATAIRTDLGLGQEHGKRMGSCPCQGNQDGSRQGMGHGRNVK